MDFLKNLCYVGAMACVVSLGCGKSNSVPPPELPAEATDPSALMEGDLKANTGGGADPTNVAP